MLISNLPFARRRAGIILFFIVSLFTTGQPVFSSATDFNPKNVPDIVRDSLSDLWVGREFSAELVSRQQGLKRQIANGALKKTDLEPMLHSTFLSLLDRQTTSRYILKRIPDRFNTLFSPQLTWDEAKPILWQTMSSVIKKEAPFVIKVGTLAPPGTPWFEVAETTVIPRIKKLSNGKILIQIYGAGVMGEDTDVLEKMDQGRLNCCGCTALGFLAACPEASALLLPGLFNNYEEVDFVFEKFRKQLDEAFQTHGYDLWNILDTGNFYLFSAKPIIGLADIKQLKALTWIGVVETALYRELGINATPVAVPDIISALSTGQADTYLAPAAWALGMQAYQYTTCYITHPFLYSPAGILVSMDIRETLKKQTGVSATFVHNIVEVIVAENYTMENEWKRQIRSYEEKSLRAFETKCGMQAITLSPEDRQQLEKAAEAVQQKLSGKMFPEKLINDIRQALADYRSASQTENSGVLSKRPD